MHPLILASSSVGRRQLLKRLGLPFVCQASGIDETPLPNEAASDLVCRLSRDKARRVARNHPQAVIIGSDQVADLNGRIFGKPGNREQAMQQLLALCGNTVHFHNGLTVLVPRESGSEGEARGKGSARGEDRGEDANKGNDAWHITTRRVTVTVDYRPCDEKEISRYLDREQPWACAGSLQSETLGITMVSRIHNDDPTALIGLPLITLSELLRPLGYPVP